MTRKTTPFQLVILHEEEVRTAAKALRAVFDETRSDDDRNAAAVVAINACAAALLGAEDDSCSLILTRVREGVLDIEPTVGLTGSAR